MVFPIFWGAPLNPHFSPRRCWCGWRVWGLPALWKGFIALLFSSGDAPGFGGGFPGVLGVPQVSGPPRHPSFVSQEVLVRVVRLEGLPALWKGFTPYYARLGPHTVLTFIFLEQLNRAYGRLFLSP